jgi:enoyl-CoA hydratase/3-hydroxyacyl-CoA dehydrogenase
MTRRFANPLLHPPARPLPRRVAVIGSGSIGPDIGYYLKSALPDIELTLVDIAQPAVDAALARLRGYGAKAVTLGKMTADGAARVQAGIRGTTDYDAIADSDWVIEAATEDLALKRRIMAMVEERVAPDALITSNSSSLPAARIFSEMRAPRRATITHFFAPAWRNVAVEVVDWPGADPALVEHLRHVLCATGKLPLMSADVPCFMLDRIFDNWCNEAALLLDRASAADIDDVALAYVHAGPFFVLNLARGNPIITETNTLQAEEEGAHYRPAPVFRSVERWLTGAAHRAGVSEQTAEDIRERLLGVLLSQTVDILDRGIGSAADLDMGCRIALGFRAGPLELMRRLGDEEAARILARFTRERPGMPAARRALAAYQDFERHVLVDDMAGIKVITLRRPEAHNALHDEMTDEILAVIRRHEHDDGVTGFVLVGYGTRAFCAGADIGRFPPLLGDADAAAQYARDCSRLLVHLDGMRKPVVAALNGMALGGGFELAMRCHGIVALREARMQLPEITLGIAPGLGAMVVPYRKWPAAAAVFHDMLCGAATLDAERAFELGIVDALADDPQALIAQALARVRALAGQLKRVGEGPVPLPAFGRTAAAGADAPTLSREVVALIEHAVRDAAAASSVSQALEIGYAAFGASACTAAAREGIGAFSEGRRPDFSAIP